LVVFFNNHRRADLVEEYFAAMVQTMYNHVLHMVFGIESLYNRWRELSINNGNVLNVRVVSHGMKIS